MSSAAPIPDPLASSLALGKVVLFAGAGMSMPQLPGWGKHLEAMLAKALTRLSQFKAISSYCDLVFTHKPNVLNKAIPKSVAVKTSPLA
jgi:hypothetical protein